MNHTIVPISENYLQGYWLALKSIIEERQYLASVQPPEFSCSQTFVRNNIQNKYPHYLALMDEDVIGWCDVIPFSRSAYSHSGLLGMGVIAKYRGLGIGEKLIRATLAKARQRGLIRVELTVRENNTPAITLYKKIGFTEIGLKNKDLLIDGQYYNSLWMELLFPF